MTLTGLPVTVEIYSWLVSHAASHTSWFDKTHADYAAINLFLSKGGEGNIEYQMLDAPVQSFLVWFFMLVASFDGGLFTEGVSQFNISGQQLTIAWDPNVHHTVSLNNWDRPTRLGVNYIVKRACGINEASNQLQHVLKPLIHYLDYYYQRLGDVVASSALAGSSVNMAQYVQKDESLLFSILSTLDTQELQAFYLNIADIFPEEVAIAGIDKPVSLRQFFANPVSNSVLAVDKVKMHYNIQLFSKVDNSIKKELKDKAVAFIKKHTLSDRARAGVRENLENVVNTQLKPRHQLLGMVLQQFAWPT
jgi:hypothetical protein